MTCRSTKFKFGENKFPSGVKTTFSRSTRCFQQRFIFECLSNSLRYGNFTFGNNDKWMLLFNIESERQSALKGLFLAQYTSQCKDWYPQTYGKVFCLLAKLLIISLTNLVSLFTIYYCVDRQTDGQPEMN